MTDSPAIPDSPLASSLHRATSTIDDLTLALTNVSRVPSPEPQQNVCCCCGNEECETTKNWLALKSKLESRLILSAEVGSALLRKHEAYVRQHEDIVTPSTGTADESHKDMDTQDAEMDARIAELIAENAVLEKRLNQALLNNEVAEAANKNVLHELEEARSAVSRLTVYHARSVTLDTRLAAVLQENDDLRQERDSQAQRAKLAEARLAAAGDRTDKLQAEVRRLQSNIEIRRVQRLDSSDSLLQEVRTRIGQLQSSHVEKPSADEDTEVMKLLESLVSDNEALKTDNEELHKLLTESREELQTLQAQVEENSILPPPIRVEAPLRHSRAPGGPSSLAKDSLLLSSARHTTSVETMSRRRYEPLTPETNFRPLSPADSLLASAARGPSFTHPPSIYPSSHMSFDADDFEHDRGLLPPNQANKAIQTDRWLSVNPNTNFTPPFMDHYSPSLHDGRSESSSLFDGQGSPMTGLLERLMSLVHRMSQADALTLTKRLKRQNLRGADVKHLSRTTVGNILSELTQLRAQYRVFLEDERMTLLCTRRDLRGLFKVFKEAFEEMSQMRVTLNDVILEPSIAGKLSELALDPVKAEAMERERKSAGSLLGASWMAPFSKLFGTTLHDLSHLTTSPSRHLDRDRGELRHPRPVPKIAPALAASTTTVNVEFSGAGAGKSVTNVFSTPASGDGIGAKDPSLGLNTQKSAVTSSNVRNVMGIFAGAPRPEDISDPWVVLPRIPRRVQSTYFRCDPSDGSPATMGKYVSRKRHMPQMSRDVDAVLDAEIICRNDSRGSDGPVPLPPDRPIHRRGLSDSSIHSTFIAQEEAGPCAQRMPPLEHPSVLQTLSKTVRSFKQVASHTISGVVHGTTVSSASSPSTTSSAPEGKASRESTDVSRPIPQRSTTPFSSLLPSLVTFGAVSSLEPGFTQSSLFGSSFREEPAIHRHLGRESQGRDI